MWTSEEARVAKQPQTQEPKQPYAGLSDAGEDMGARAIAQPLIKKKRSLEKLDGSRHNVGSAPTWKVVA
jgi:hypothetical protein